MKRSAIIPVLLLPLLMQPLLSAQARIEGQSELRPTVGMRAKITDLVLPGAELIARRVDELDPAIVLRVLDARMHGSDFRYDIEYYGLEPGRFDLSDYLARKDGAAAELPAVEVEIQPVLPPGQVEPNKLESMAPGGLGGYGKLLFLGGAAWIAGLLAILLYGRNSAAAQEAAEQAAAPTLADRLQPMVEAAQQGKLDDRGKAQLERLLVAFWRERLGLGDQEISKAIVTLRGHDEAGPLLLQLERWLHRPDRGEAADAVDLQALLEPYRSAPAPLDAELDGGVAAGGVDSGGVDSGSVRPGSEAGSR